MLSPADLTTVWYTSGTINIINGPWTGVLIYSGGKAPTYSFSNNKAAPITGTLTAVSRNSKSASLVDVSTNGDYTQVATKAAAAIRGALLP